MDSQLPRVVGMSNRLRSAHLLKKCPGRASEPESEPEPRQKAKSKVSKTVPGVHDPPVASDAEDDDSHDEKTGFKYSPQSSSDTERPARGNIKSTKFTPSSQTNRLPSRQARNQAEKTGSETSETKRSNESQPKSAKRPRLSNASDGGISSRASAGRDSSILSTSSGGHFTTEYGFSRKSKPKQTYGGRARGSRASSSQEDRKTKAPEDPPRTVFQRPPDYDSPQKLKSTKLIVPENELGVSPSQDKPAKRLPTLCCDDSDTANGVLSPAKTKTAYKAPRLSVPSKVPPGPRLGQKEKANPMVPIKRNRARKASSKPPSPPSAKFLIPVRVSDFKPRKQPDDCSDDGSLSDAPSAASNEKSALGSPGEEEEAEAEVNKTSLCPWCSAPVDKEFLHGFSKGKQLHPKMQAKFCATHKKRTAMETWESRQYPQVEWDSLAERFEKHRELLLGIINGRSSHYRNILASKIGLGQARLAKYEPNLNPGYYGPRGFNIMCDYLIDEFSDILRDKAAHDKVIAGRGSAAFIQSVLVGELGVQLISEDMGVSAESARDILEESKDLGELVHGEL